MIVTHAKATYEASLVNPDVEIRIELGDPTPPIMQLPPRLQPQAFGGKVLSSAEGPARQPMGLLSPNSLQRR